jgi:hypothetical protein
MADQPGDEATSGSGPSGRERTPDDGGELAAHHGRSEPRTRLARGERLPGARGPIAGSAGLQGAQLLCESLI